jgi:transposase
VANLSKTHLLGLIILAFELLRNLNFPVPRIIAAVALRLGVSRKAGYAAARRIEQALGAPPSRDEGDELQRENARLRIKLQVVTFERNHPAVRFSRTGRHLPREARALLVRLFRDFRSTLPEAELAELIGVALSSLRRWERLADADGHFPQKPERRGAHRRATVDDENRVVKFFESLEESLTLEAFSGRFNAAHPGATLDRKTISRILERRGLKKAKPRSAPERYHEKVEVYFPGAQVAIDAKKCAVRFTGAGPETVRVAKETAIDIATGTIMGSVVGREETREGVERVLVGASAECEKILAVLADNRSANTAADIRRVIGGEEKVGAIFSFPYHPQTNGHIEGHFGEFSRIVGEITIDDTSRETISRSVVEALSRVFDHFHNNMPVKALGWLTRREYLRRYSPTPEEVADARRKLLGRQARSRALREEAPRLSDDAFRQLVKSTLEDHRLEVDFKRALRSLASYDHRVIESAACAFYVASRRDGFDERKRTFAYFMGIVRNKQRAVDARRQKESATRLESRKFSEKLERQAHLVAEDAAEERDDLARRPERVILEYAKLFLSGGLTLRRRTCLGKIRQALASLRRLGRAQGRVIEKLSLTIRGWGEFPEALKKNMVELLRAEYQSLLAVNLN